jgi:hypothetical protein
MGLSCQCAAVCGALLNEGAFRVVCSVLDLSNNGLSGIVPTLPEYLDVTNLSGNVFCGPAPFDFVVCSVPAPEIDALFELYRSTGGAQWTLSTNWLSGNPCTWFGVTCNAAGNSVV